MEPKKRGDERLKAAAEKKAAAEAKVAAEKAAFLKAGREKKAAEAKAEKAKKSEAVKEANRVRLAKLQDQKDQRKKEREDAAAKKKAEKEAAAVSPEAIAAAAAKAAAKAAKDAEKASQALVIAAVHTELKPFAKEINERFALAAKLDSKADDHRLAAAIQLDAAKKKYDASGVDFKGWKIWVAENIKGQAYETVRKLVAVGGAEDPKLALADLRNRTAASNKALRDKKKAAEAGLVDTDEEGDSEEGETVKARARTTQNADILVGIDALKAAFGQLRASDKVAFVTWAAVEIGAELDTGFEEEISADPVDAAGDEPGAPVDAIDEAIDKSIAARPGLVRRS